MVQLVPQLEAKRGRMMCQGTRAGLGARARPIQEAAAVAVAADPAGMDKRWVTLAALAALEVVAPQEERVRPRRTLLRELVSRVPSPAMAVAAAVAASIYFTAARVRRAAAEYSREVPEVKVVPETAAEAAAEAERAEPTMCCREAPPTMSDSAVRGLPAQAAPVDRVQPGSVVQAVPVGLEPCSLPAER